MATVSVIVPNYNHEKYLRKRVESILAQTYQDFELILLDDGSTDGSREILSAYAENARARQCGVATGRGIIPEPRVRVEFNAQNSGTPFKQWNKGVRMARGKYVWIAESDDYADARFLERTVGALEGDTEVTLAFCRSWKVGEDDELLGLTDGYLYWMDASHWTEDFVAEGKEECRKYFVICNPVLNASAVVFRKEVYERVGRVDERYRVCGDYKVWAAMAMEGKIAYLSEPANYFRYHQENVRTRTEPGALDVAEYLHAMRWVVGQVAEAGTLEGRPGLEELYPKMPAEMSGEERLRAAGRTLGEVARWNLRYNREQAKEKMRAYFLDWEFALVGKEFAMRPPNRWRFFLHRAQFYRRYAGGMNWKQKLVNLGRVAGAPVVGYQKRHWPEQAYSWIAAAINRTLE